MLQNDIFLPPACSSTDSGTCVNQFHVIRANNKRCVDTTKFWVWLGSISGLAKAVLVAVQKGKSIGDQNEEDVNRWVRTRSAHVCHHPESTRPSILCTELGYGWALGATM